jgi:hypothetical protein
MRRDRGWVLSAQMIFLLIACCILWRSTGTARTSIGVSQFQSRSETVCPLATTSIRTRLCFRYLAFALHDCFNVIVISRETQWSPRFDCFMQRIQSSASSASVPISVHCMLTHND